MYLIDTNIFLEAMLSRSRAQECIELLKMLKDGKIEGVVTDFFNNDFARKIQKIK